VGKGKGDGSLGRKDDGKNEMRCNLRNEQPTFISNDDDDHDVWKNIGMVCGNKSFNSNDYGYDRERK